MDNDTIELVAQRCFERLEIEDGDSIEDRVREIHNTTSFYLEQLGLPVLQETVKLYAGKLIEDGNVKDGVKIMDALKKSS